jgi:class 3 adenylate cyclase
MCVGGLESANEKNVINTVSAAIEIRDFMDTEKKRRALNNQFYFDIRIGLHKGPVIAGIVGIKKFAYDIWGNTVNIASRMESASEPGKINVSGETYQLIKDHFICDYRGKVMAKNKGDIDMYFVERKI